MSHGEDTASCLLKRLEDAETARKVLEQQWRHLYKVYKGDTAPKLKGDEDWHSTVYVRHAFQQVETLLPELVAEEASFEVVPFEPTDEPAAKVNEEMLRYQLQRDRFLSKRAAATKKVLIFGGVPLKVSMAREIQRMKVRQFHTPEQMAAIMLADISDDEKRQLLAPYVEKDVVVKNDPTMIVCDPFDVFVDPSATRWDLEDARYVMHRTWLSAEELLAKERAGLYKGVTKYLRERSQEPR